MNHATAVSPLQPIADLNSALRHLHRGQRTLPQPIGQGLALQKLHDKKIDALLTSYVMEGADIGMV